MIQQQIIEAIQTKRLLKFDYDHYRRIVEPHIFGVAATGLQSRRSALCANLRKAVEELHG